MTMQMQLHHAHHRPVPHMPFVYVCILCDEWYHSTELLEPGEPPVCPDCCKREEDTAKACASCGGPTYFDSPICHECEMRQTCNSETPYIDMALAHIMNGEKR